MPSGKLHLKRTPAEQAAHDLRKASKAARKAAKRAVKADDSGSDPELGRSRKRQKSSTTYNYVFDIDDEEPYGPQPYNPSSSGFDRAHQPDYDYIRTQLEEEWFREKMWGALRDDERLDGVEAGLNSYAHIPRRWRSGGMERMDDEVDIDPQMMEDEDYAEWVRKNMWKKKHAAEFAEQERKKAERAARLEREKALHEETRRLEKAEEERRRQRYSEKEKKRWSQARHSYEAWWTGILRGGVPNDLAGDLRFSDIAWPVLVTNVGPSHDKKGKARAEVVDVDLEDITQEAIAFFLLPGGRPADSTTCDPEMMKKERKEKLRETMLRFHPDKFEGRIMGRVWEKDKEKVGDAVGKVTRAVNELLAQRDS